MPWPVTIPKEQRPEVAKNAIARYLDGERLQEVADGYGLSLPRLYAYLLEHQEIDWKTAQVGVAIDRLERAKADLETAQSMQDIARARELAKLAQWDLERVCRRVYGTDPPVQFNINLDLGSVSDRIAELERELLSQTALQHDSKP